MADSGTDAFASDPRVIQILDIFAKETAVDRAALRPDATIEDLGVASLDLTMAVFQLESAFNIEIPVIADRSGPEFRTVGELISHVVTVLDRKSAGASSAALSAEA